MVPITSRYCFVLLGLSAVVSVLTVLHQAPALKSRYLIHAGFTNVESSTNKLDDDFASVQTYLENSPFGASHPAIRAALAGLEKGRTEHFGESSNDASNDAFVAATDSTNLGATSPKAASRDFVTADGPGIESHQKEHNNSPLRLVPDQVLEEWKQLHGKEALFADNQREHADDRKFLVVDYSCPRRAGNILHDFTSTLQLAILTNRTLLFRYAIVSPYRRMKVNNETECEAVFGRHNWIPRYEDVVAHFNFTRASEDALFTVPGEDWSADFPDQVENIGHFRFIKPGNYRGIDRSWTRHGSQWRGLVSMEDERVVNYLSARYGVKFPADKIEKLYKHGIHYMYGMLLFHSFQFSEEFMKSIKMSTQPHTGAISIGLHSRHTSVDNDGADVRKEIMCLEKLLGENRNESQPCEFYLMADRPLTVENLVKFAEKKGCSAIVAEKEASNVDNSEHGVFAGAGFFRDLAVLQYAQHGFAGTVRSSSALVVEAMEYNRIREAYSRNELQHLEPIPRCNINAMKLPDVRRRLLSS